MFSDSSTAHKIVDYYEGVHRQLRPLQANLKAAAKREKLEKDELKAEQERVRRDKYVMHP